MRYGSQDPTTVVAPEHSGAVDALDGSDAVRFAARFGLVLDPWQAALCELWMRRDVKTGKFLAGTWGISVPRQNGKNGTLEAVELYGMVVLGLRFMHTAHEVKTAQKHFRRMKEFFGRKRDDPDAKFPELNRLVKEIRNVNGQEAIFLHNPETLDDLGSIEIIARSDGSGRGFTNDMLVLDEAQHLKDEQLEANRPAISAAPSGDPVAIYMGTPPKPSALSGDGAGAAFVRVRNGAVSGEAERAAWMEFAAEVDGESLSDEELREYVTNRKNWAATNPALGRRLFEQTLVDELAEMGPRSFFRERMNGWPVAREGAAAALDPAAWSTRILHGPVPPDWPLAAIGLDMDVHGRVWVAVAAHAAAPVVHVELLPDDPLEGGTDAAVQWLWQRCKRRLPVVMPADSGAVVLEAPLLARGVKVYRLNTGEQAQCSSAMVQAVKDGEVTHLDDPLLAQAVRESTQAKLRTGWKFGRDGETSGAPLWAVSCARFGAVKWSKRRSPERVGRGRERVSRERNRGAVVS